MMTTTQDNQKSVDIVVILSEDEALRKGKVRASLDARPMHAASMFCMRCCPLLSSLLLAA